MTSISAERSRLSKVGVTLRRREQWGARRSYTDARTVTEPATKQFVHITVTNPGNYNSFDAHARAIEAIGISRFPNTGISYNRLFMAGTRNAYEAQPIGRRGAHTVNDFRRSTCSLSGCPSRGTSLSAPSWNLNFNARAYAYASNVGFSVPDHVIDDMARSMAADRLAGFVSRNATIHGHRCVSSKSCPGDRMWARMGDLEKRVNWYLKNLSPDTTPQPPKDDHMSAADVEALKKYIDERTLTSEGVKSGVLGAVIDMGNGPDSRSRTARGKFQEIMRVETTNALIRANQVDPAELAAALAPVLVQLLPSGQAPTKDTLVEALREVFGSLDEN